MSRATGPGDGLEVIVYTDRRVAAPRRLDDVVCAAVAGGARYVVLREKDLPDEERAALAALLRAAIAPDRPAATADVLLVSGRDGRHRDSAGRVIGRACHSAAELAGAVGEGAAYATLSPVFASASKPGYGPPLGLRALAELCADARLPVYALGGVDSTERAAACVAAGAAGIAVLGAVMRATDPRAVVAELKGAICVNQPSR